MITTFSCVFLSFVHVLILDGSLNRPGEAISSDYQEAISESHDVLEWHRDVGEEHPADEADVRGAPADGRAGEGGEGAREQGDDGQAGPRLAGVSYRSPHRGEAVCEGRKGLWDDAARANGVCASPPSAVTEVCGWRGAGGHCDTDEPDMGPEGFLSRARAFQAEELRYRRDSSHSEEEGEALGREAWAGALSDRQPEMDKARINLSLLEQAMVLQSEQRQVLHHAYKEMDRFLLEQMSNERMQHQRLQDMEVRSGYNGCKGTSPCTQREPNNAHT